MKVTVKGQVTIPRHIRDKLGITPNTEVNFQEEGRRVYLTKKKVTVPKKNKFRRYRGIATVRMTTDEIMALTRDRK
ncbi:MAG: AbrB/MazE/SpoVT family DNA-binding domain-containing protein [Candidatus Scalindua sp.]